MLFRSDMKRARRSLVKKALSHAVNDAIKIYREQNPVLFELKCLDKNDDHVELADALQDDNITADTAENFAKAIDEKLSVSDNDDEVVDTDVPSSKSIVKPVIEASAIACVASCKELLGDIKGAEKELRRALKLLPSNARVDRARYRQNLANVIKKKGNLKEAKKLYMDVLEEFQSIFGKDAPNMYIAATLVNLGVCHIQLAEYHDAQKHMHQALEAFQNLHGKDTPHPHIVSVLTSLGNIYEARQKLARARQYREQSLAMTLDLYVSCC